MMKECMFIYKVVIFNKIMYLNTLNNDHIINKNVINIYIVYRLDQIASIRYTTFTIQNALFEAMQITNYVDTSKYHYKRYGICFDESEQFSHTIT